ncbi:hypothetical protein A9R05_39905 (plasmid) [Burkholderia sp. KK1]|nr:hypothetical protein A9R05_39905 [Burkholderia sp. KK1]
MNKVGATQPLRSVDLEIWRTRHGLTISAACELLGLQRQKWTELHKTPSEPIDDMAVCILLLFYFEHPETIPMSRVIDIQRDMHSLGLNPEDPSDKKEYAIAHGREPTAAYRWLGDQGAVGKPVERLMEAVSRLDTSSPDERRNALRKVATEVANRQGVSDPFARGTWRRDA